MARGMTANPGEEITKMVSALVVDDEPLARVHLRRALEQQGARVCDEAEDVASALRMTEELQPEVVFLDIHMPGLTGLQMAEALTQMQPAPLVVFVTGYAEHAISAFHHGAIDYLLKPVSADRLLKTLVRVRARLGDSREREKQVLAVEQHAHAEAIPLRRLPVRTDYAVNLIRLEEIVYAQARDKRVMVITRDGEHRTYYTLRHLEELLPSDRFARVHDSFLVNLDFVEQLIFLGNHSYELKVADGRLIPVGRTRYADLVRRLRLDASTSG